MIDTEALANLYLTQETQSGKKLKNLLGLNDYRFVWIRKILDISVPIYIIIYDSRFPNIYLSMSKVKKLKALSITKTKRVIGQELKDLKYSIPMLIDEYNNKIVSNSVICAYDIAGEYYSKN